MTNAELRARIEAAKKSRRQAGKGGLQEKFNRDRPEDHNVEVLEERIRRLEIRIGYLEVAYGGTPMGR